MIQCFNQQSSCHRIFYCERFPESKFDVKYVNTMKSVTSEVRVFNVIKCL